LSVGAVGIIDISKYIQYNRKQINFISYMINNNRMSDSANENQLNKEFKKIKEEEEKKKKLLSELKQPENPLRRRRS
jgi:hypothetical protein